MGSTTDAFAPLGAPVPVTLVAARVELHWAVQIVAAVGRALIPPVADDSHTSLEWLEAERALAGGATPGRLRLGVRPADLTLVLLDPDGGPRRELALAGRTLEEARRWAAAALGPVPAVVPPYEMAPHPVSSGGAFAAGHAAERAELERWYAAADRVLREVRRASSRPPRRASLVRCWPHHFDLATLIELPPGASAQARTIGVGLSPGDGSYHEPYFYVTPWPYPAPQSEAELPVLPEPGVWHRDGWFGAALTATAIFADAQGSPATRAQAVSRFLEAAAGAAATLLELDAPNRS
jgi:hypothetical protein